MESSSGPVLHIVLAEAAIEPVPQDLWSHPSVSKQAKLRKKRPGQTLLDDTYHHSAMRKAMNAGKFLDSNRRGRPDITHSCFLTLFESRLALDGRLRVSVHTRNNERIDIVPDLRVQRAQYRFYGLLEQLFEHGAVPPDGRENVLMSITDNQTLAHVVQHTGAKHVVVCDEGGGDTRFEELIQTALAGGDDDASRSNEVLTVVVGAYPTGPFESNLAAFEHQTLSLGSEPLAAWTVVGELVTRFRMATGGD